jgi:peroxiredoxin
VKKTILCGSLILLLSSVSVFAQLAAPGADNSPKVGDTAPDFALSKNSNSVQATSLKDLQGKKRVLVMFFPGAFTPGCTTEFTEAGQKFDQITALNIEMIGVSRDMPGAQGAFKTAVGAKNGFVSDPDLTVMTKYGAINPTREPKQANRFYFLVDEKGKVIWRSVDGKLIPTDQLIADLSKLLNGK